MSAVKNFLVLFSDCVRYKIFITEYLRIIEHASRISPPDYSKLATNQKDDNSVIICRHAIIFLTLSYFSHQIYLLVQVLCQYHFLFSDNFCLKSDSHIQKVIVIGFNESPLKMTKNTFYFILKALFFLKIIKFLSWQKRQDWFQNLWLHSLVHKLLQYIVQYLTK